MKSSPFSEIQQYFSNTDGTNFLLEFYNTFSNRLLQARDFRSIINAVYDELRRVYHTHQIEFLLRQPDDTLVLFRYDEANEQVAPAEEFDEDSTLYTYALERRRAFLTNEYHEFCRQLGVHHAGLEAQSWLGVPIKVRGKMLGLLVVWHPSRKHYFRIQDRQFLSGAANMVSYALENLYLADFVSEQNGVAAVPLPRLNVARNGKAPGTRAVLTQLLTAVTRQAGVQYAGIFLRRRAKNRWRILDEAYREAPLSSLGIPLMKVLPNLPRPLVLEAEHIYWHRRQSAHPLNTLLAEPLRDFPVNALLAFPFDLLDDYLGMVVIAFDRDSDRVGDDEMQLLRYIQYLAAQLIEKRIMLDRNRKFQLYTKHLERMKVAGELASGTAHHLNNILSVIIGKGQLLHKSLSDTVFERDLRILLQAAKDGAKSIERLQTYATRGERPEENRTLNLNFLVQEVIEIARPRFEGEAQSRGIHYELDLALQEADPISGDAPALREAMLNLVNNALDAMPRGGKLTIRTLTRDDKVMVFVSDTGIGIPKEIRSKIFDPFYTTKGRQGNGLGLSIAMEIVQKHKGKIYVDSVPHKGSVFMIELPVCHEAGDAEPAAPEPEFFQQLAYKVLLVEDEGVVRETLAEMLEEEGCEVLIAPDSEQALLAFQKFDCDVVFADLSMPGKNGVTLARELKALQKEVPVFIITGWNKGDDALKDARAIADGIIQKPFNMDQIRLEMVKAIGKRRQFHRNGLSV